MPYKDPEKKRANQRSYYQANKEQVLARQRGYNETHREHRLARGRAYAQTHKEERRVNGQVYYQAHKDKWAAWGRANSQHRKEQRRERVARLKGQVFNAYGGAFCYCCGASHLEFLSVDHSDGKGAEHRRKVTKGGAGVAIYRWLRDQGYPPGFRVLCMNCNCALAWFGYCPHGNVQVEPSQGPQH